MQPRRFSLPQVTGYGRPASSRAASRWPSGRSNFHWFLPIAYRQTPPRARNRTWSYTTPSTTRVPVYLYSLPPRGSDQVAASTDAFLPIRWYAWTRRITSGGNSVTADRFGSPDRGSIAPRQP